MYQFNEEVNIMKKDKEKKTKKIKKKANRDQVRYDRGQVFVKIVAAIIASMMIISVAVSGIYAIFG